MAATDQPPAASARAGWGPVVLAALALPGLAAQAETGPDQGLVSLKWLSYRDWQPGLERIAVRSPALLVQTPALDRWSLEASATADSVSGASPRWHTAVSGASRMSDERRAADVKVVRYADRSSWSVGAAASDENDFRSRAVSVGGGWASDDNNRSWSVGAAFTEDRIGSADDDTLDERRRTFEATVAATAALSRTDLVQASLALAQGHGFYSDPYKRADLRPSSRHQTVASLRWNHHFEDSNTTLRSAYRHYRDSFGVHSHTLTLEPVLQPSPRITLTPSLRLYTQSAAWFYFDPIYSYLGAPYPPGYTEPPAGPLSADQRLAAFGALTVGVRLVMRLGDDWTADIMLERYEQRTAWRVGGTGSPGLAPFSARMLQWGLSRSY